MNKRWTWIVLALGISVFAYYAAGFGIGHALSPTNRFRIILAMLFAQSAGLIILGAVISGLISDLRTYHQAATQVAMLKGLWRSLDLAVDRGGLSNDARAAIYREADEVFSVYEKLTGTPRVGSSSER